MNATRYIHLGMALALILALGLVAPPARADLNQQMETMFNAMTNVTDPTISMDQRRGVITGGRFSLRTEAMNVEILSIIPPSYQAGCGGIDLFGGSFSFISLDRFIQLLRSIAANAPAYAFRMAMQAMCPSCDQIMQEMQSIIQNLNGLTVSACQQAEGIATMATSLVPNTIQTSIKKTTSNIARGIGAVNDALSGWFPSMTKGQSAYDKVNQTDPNKLEEQGVKGNIVWNALQDSGVASWWSAGDTNFLEAIMSVSGSVIIRPGPNPEAEPSVTVLTPILDIKDFMQGSGPTEKVEVYECISSKCYDPNDTDRILDDPKQVKVTVQSFRSRVEDMVTQIAYKFANNYAFTNAERAFMAAMPAAAGGMIRNLARQGTGIANVFAHRFSKTIANIMITNLVMDMVGAVKHALAQYGTPLNEQLLDNIHDVTQDLRGQTMNLKMEYQGLMAMTTTYTQRMKAAQKVRLGIEEIVKDNALRVK